MNPSTYYVPEGETRTLEIVGVRIGNDEAEPFVVVDGTALLLLARVREADSDDPLLIKQFGASELLLAGLSPDHLDTGQVVQVTRFEDGGYEVESELEDVSDAM